MLHIALLLEMRTIKCTLLIKFSKSTETHAAKKFNERQTEETVSVWIIRFADL